MHKSFNNYIFDMDGTIVNSSLEILECLKCAFRRSGFDIDENKFSSDIIGPPIREIIHLVAPNLDDEEKENEIVKNFRKIYDFDNNDVSTLYDGIYDYLSDLKKDNKKLYIATFKPIIPTRRLLHKFNLDMFDAVYTVDSPVKFTTKSEMVKYMISVQDLNKEDTVMVGDGFSDVMAAKDNGVYAVAVSWGYGSDKSVLKQQADIVIGSIEDLKNV